MKVTGLVKIYLCAILFLIVASGSSFAKENSFVEALKSGTPNMTMRLRHESVSEKTKDANALTLRTQLGYKTEKFMSSSAYIQMENVTAIGDPDNNPGYGKGVSTTVRGKSTSSIVADPEGSEVNQIYVQSDFETGYLRLGRQVIILNNSRHVGNVGWRQNEQTYDAYTLVCKDMVDFSLSYITNVNSIFGTDTLMASPVLNVAKGFSFGKIAAYGIVLDYDSAASNSADKTTYGVRLDGKTGDAIKYLYELEYATQSDSGDNTNSISVDYTHISLGAAIGGIVFKAGLETLGSDKGASAFSTPLGTNHKFNGWADKFLSAGNDGLADTYAVLGFKTKTSKIFATYHTYAKDFGTGDYGTEADLVAACNMSKNLSVGFKYADFSEDSSTSLGDVTKYWLWTQIKF